MLRRSAISLQVSNFSVKHWPGKLNAIPEMLSRLLEFQQSERLYTPTTLAPICHTIAGNPNLRTRAPQNLYRLGMDDMAKLTPALGIW